MPQNRQYSVKISKIELRESFIEIEISSPMTIDQEEFNGISEALRVAVFGKDLQWKNLIMSFTVALADFSEGKERFLNVMRNFLYQGYLQEGNIRAFALQAEDIIRNFEQINTHIATTTAKLDL